MKHPIVYPFTCSAGVLLFFLCFLDVLPVCVLNHFPHRGYKLEACPPEDNSCRESHSTLAFAIHCTFTPLFRFVLFSIVLFCFSFKVCVSFGSRSPSPCQNMSRTTEHVGHWEDLETLLSVAIHSILPKAA